MWLECLQLYLQNFKSNSLGIRPIEAGSPQHTPHTFLWPFKVYISEVFESNESLYMRKAASAVMIAFATSGSPTCAANMHSCQVSNFSSKSFYQSARPGAICISLVSLKYRRTSYHKLATCAQHTYVMPLLHFRYPHACQQALLNKLVLKVHVYSYVHIAGYIHIEWARRLVLTYIYMHVNV